MNEVRRLAAEEAILNEVTSFVRRDSAGSQDTQTQDDVVEGLVQQYARLVYRICHAALRNHQDAEDATQETFLRVFRYNSKLAAVKEPKPWLARIAWRVAIDHGKRRGRAKEVSLDDPEKWPGDLPSRAVSADDLILGSRFGETLERLIGALPEKLRAPLILSTVQEMSPREVAAALAINEAAVRSRVFRARNILREKLAEQARRK